MRPDTVRAFLLLLDNLKNKYMKTKLLLAFSLFSLIGFAQAPVASYYGTNNVVFAIVAPTGVNHTPSGANANWNFSNLAILGESADTQTLPTAGEISTFPGTTAVVTTQSYYDDNTSATFKLYSKAPSNALSLTGMDNDELMLNYNTNNALLGTFPLSFGYNNTDNVAGNYDNGAYAGTFSGTINTTVDAWGTLNVAGTNINAFNGAVTRLKTVQNLSLNYGAFPNVGTVTVTTYSYYGTNLIPVGIPRFRSTVTTVNVPLLSINQTVTQNEAFAAILLGTYQPQQNLDALAIAPNPVENTLNIESDAQKIQSVTLTDVTGKIILTDRSQSKSIEVGHLQKGIYFATIATDLGSTVKKFIKK